MKGELVSRVSRSVKKILPQRLSYIDSYNDNYTDSYDSKDL